jgi:hypothetical protein
LTLNDYIRGQRHGSEAHDIELASMRDPFLAEAIEGFDAIAGDHLGALENLSERVLVSASGGRAAARARASRRRESITRAWSIAMASLFLAAAVGASVWLLRDGLTSTRPSLASRSGGYSSEPEVAIMPPVIVIPDEAAPTDVSSLTLDSRETRDFTYIASPAPDTVQTVAFRRYVAGALALGGGVQGSVTLSFDVSTEGRPAGVAVIDSPSSEASEAALELLSHGPDWPREPVRKQITINL